MRDEDVAKRLKVIANDLLILYRQVGEQEAAEVEARSATFEGAYHTEGVSASAAIEIAKSSAAPFTIGKLKKRAMIYGLEQERDMLMFVAERGWHEWV